MKKNKLYFSAVLLMLVLVLFFSPIKTTEAFAPQEAPAAIVNSFLKLLANIKIALNDLLSASTGALQNSQALPPADQGEIETGTEDFKDYIITFDKQPLAVEYQRLLKTVKKTADALKSTSKYKSSLISGRNTKIEEIRKTLKKEKTEYITATGNREEVSLNSKNLNVLTTWEGVLNGVLVDMTAEEAEKVKEIPGLKVFPNYKVEATLSDSVPLIGADKVWQVDKDGNNCLTSGKECLTGKGTKIAIIDTGVDYNSKELGGNYVENIFHPLLMEGSNEVSVPNFGPNFGYSNIFFHNKNLVFHREWELYFFNFDSGEVKKIGPNSPYVGIFGIPDIFGSKVTYYSWKIGSKDLGWIIYDIKSGNKNEVNIYCGDYSKPYDYCAVFPLTISSEYAVAYFRKFVNGQPTAPNILAYNLKTGEVKELQNLIIGRFGTTNQVYGDKIAYFNIITGKLYLYDITNNINTELTLGSENVGMVDKRFAAIVDFKDDVIVFIYRDLTSLDYNIGYYNLNSNDYYLIEEDKYQTEAIFSNNTIFYIKDQPRIMASGQLVALDINTKKKFYFGNMSVESFAADSNKIVVVSGNKLYYHDFDPNKDYPEDQPDFPNNKVIGGYDFINNDSDPIDDNGHGTHVAGIAAGTGNGGLKGVAPDAKIYGFKVLNSSGSGYASNIISAINTSVDLNKNSIPCENKDDYVDVLNMSLGGSGNPDDPISTAVDNATCTISVVAAGNSGSNANTITSPGTARKAITVGATDKQDVIANFSSRGPVVWPGGTLNKPDVVAPGVSICSAQWDSAWADRQCFDNKHVALRGTSMATPHVAGAVALLKQVRPNLTSDDIKSVLNASSKNLGYDINTQGAGRIDIFKALDSMGTCADSDNGENHFVKGKTDGISREGLPYSYEDSCSRLKLVEWYCDGNHLPQKKTISCVGLYGRSCKNGACLR